jgi:acyl dehydratase
MPIDGRHIGVESEPRTVEVEKGQLKFFAKATCESNPIFFDEEAARKAGHPAIPVPPTFLFSMHLGAPARRGDVFDRENGVGVDMKRVLHGEQSFTYHRPIYAGERIVLTTRTSDIYQKKGGALEFVVQDTSAVDEAGELRAEMTMVTVVRND